MCGSYRSTRNWFLSWSRGGLDFVYHWILYIHWDAHIRLASRTLLSAFLILSFGDMNNY